MRVIASLRCSTDEQSEKQSLPTQESAVLRYCAQHGHELVAIHRDEGLSGKLAPERRPGLAACLAALRAKQADGLIVAKLDRMSRSIIDVVQTVAEFDRKGWALISVAENIDTKSAMGRMFVHMLAVLGQLERELISERTRDALAQLAREGKRRSRYAPLGFAFDQDGRTVPAPNEQPALATIAAIRAKGHGPRTIARTLNEAGIRNPRSGGLWHPSTVAGVLRTMARRSA